MIKQFLGLNVEHIVLTGEETQARTVLARIIHIVENAQQLCHLILLADEVRPLLPCLKHHFQALATCRDIDKQNALGLQVELGLDALEQLTRVAAVVDIDDDQSAEIGVTLFTPASALTLVILLRACTDGKVGSLKAGTWQRRLQFFLTIPDALDYGLGRAQALLPFFPNPSAPSADRYAFDK